MDILNSLVDSSLVEPEACGDEPRFGLPETIREYALGRLRDGGAWQEAHDRHAAYFTALARPAESELRGEGQLAWLNRLEAEIDNLSAALSWLMDQDRLDQAITFIWMTWRLWWLRGHVADVARHWEKLMAQGREMAPHKRALALSGTGFTFIADGDQDKAQSAFEQSLLYDLALSSQARGDLDGAAGLLRQGLSLAAEAGDEPATAYYLEALAAVARQQDDPQRAARLLAAAAAQLRASGSGWLHAYVPRAPHDHSIEADLRSRLGDAAYEQAAAHGRSLTGTRAVQYGLENPHQDPQRHESPA